MTYDQKRETADYVLGILSAQSIKVMSWGAEGFSPAEYNGMPALSFKVNGFLHKGQVYVCYNEGADLFEVFTIGRSGSVKIHEEEVYFEALVEVIDAMVEVGGWSPAEYSKRIRDEYGFQTNQNDEQ